MNETRNDRLQLGTDRHTPQVTYAPGRYVYRPSCSCGWTHGRGYVAEHAAQAIAEEHAAGRL